MAGGGACAGSPGGAAAGTGAWRAVAHGASHLPVVARGTHVTVVPGGAVPTVLEPRVSRGEEKNGKVLEIILTS